MNKPHIYSFMDAHDYLVASVEWKKQEDPQFSVRKWAATINIKADTLIELLKKKKNLTFNLIMSLSQGLELSANEEAYFVAMMKYSNAVSINEKNILLLVLGEMASSHGKTVEVEDNDIFKHWVYVAILVMSELEGFQSSASFIKQALSHEVSEEIIQEGISKLLRTKLLSFDENGNLFRTQDHVVTKNDVSQAAIHSYYEQVTDLAKDSIKLPLDEREFQCFSFAIDDEQLPLIKEAIREFRAKITSIPKKKADRLYHMNMQLFPLTRSSADFRIDS